jgi:peptidoglycan/xylan/chitin deacetylase (PgdA/CDA1 family)
MSFRPLVLCYHAVSDRWTDPLAVGPAVFEKQLRLLLRAGLRPVDAGGVLAGRRRTLHVTFDDAYRNVASAVPILERLRVHATVFACSGYARDGRILDVPELRDRRGRHPEELETMAWDALRELAARGVEIGSHTVSHAHLPQLSDEELARELAESRQHIEAELGRPCRFLSYPYGEDDARVHAAARAAGYTGAYTLRRKGADVNVHALPRVDVYRPDGTARFLVKASPLYGPATSLLDCLRRRRATAPT